MASPRSLANHSLYLGKLLTQAWQQQLAQEQVPAVILADAFAVPAARHLVTAYGWFLLALADIKQVDLTPPSSVTGLPAVVAGKAQPAELAEFAQLESSGWLAQLRTVAAGSSAHAAANPRSGANLAVASVASATPEDLLQWADQLAGLFSRMSEGLDEC